MAGNKENMGAGVVIHNVSDYNAFMKDIYGDQEGYVEMGSWGTSAANNDSEQRNAIASRMQQLVDNGIQLGDPDAQAKFDAFLLDVSGQEGGDGLAFGKTFLGIGADKKMNKQELQSLGNMMMQLDTMRDDGSLTMEEYTDYMTKLFQPETFDDLVAGGNKAFAELADAVCTDNIMKEPDPEVAAANKEMLVFESRQIINGGNDYKASYNERHEITDPTTPTANESEIAAKALLQNALNGDEPAISQEQYDAMNGFLRDGGIRGSSNHELIVMAMTDAIESGNPELIDKFMNPDTYKMDVVGYDDMGNPMYSSASTNQFVADLADLDRSVRGIETLATKEQHTENTASGKYDIEESKAAQMDHDYALSNDDIDLVLDGGPDGRYEMMRSAAIDIWMGKYGNGAARKETLAQAGFSEQQISDLGKIVDATQGNMYGLDEKMFDDLFGERDGTLAEQREGYGEIVSRVMTYEGPGDMAEKLGERVGGIEGATQMYMNAAEYLTAHQDEIGKGFDRLGEHGEAAKDEVTMNLESYMATGVAAFEGSDRNADTDIEASKAAQEKVAEETGFEFGE